jgi:hypothetical protein
MTMASTIEALKGKKFKAVPPSPDMADTVREKAEELQGRVIEYVDFRPAFGKNGDSFRCVLCGHTGRKPHIVKNEKGEERMCGPKCLELFFDIRIKMGKKGGNGRKTDL